MICQRAGIEIKMITGDNGVPAAAIAKELEIDGEGEPIDGRVLNRMLMMKPSRNACRIPPSSRG